MLGPAHFCLVSSQGAQSDGAQGAAAFDSDAGVRPAPLSDFGPHASAITLANHAVAIPLATFVIMSSSQAACFFASRFDEHTPLRLLRANQEAPRGRPYEVVIVGRDVVGSQ
jgi:hypothetical protein